MEKWNRWLHKTFGDNDPKAPKCCICFPMKCGIYMIGMLAFINFGSMIGTTQHYFPLDEAAGALSMIGVVAMLVSLALFMRYFCQDSYAARAHLRHACTINAIANILAYIGIVIGALNEIDIPDKEAYTAIPNYVLPGVIWCYFRYICTKWMELGEEVGQQEVEMRAA